MYKRWITIVIAIIVVSLGLLWCSKEHLYSNEIMTGTVVSKDEATSTVIIEFEDGTRQEYTNEEFYDYCQEGETVRIETQKSWFWKPHY